MFPGAAAQSNGLAVRFAWPSYPFTKGSYAAYRVGQYTTIAGAEIERVDGVHFCGEHTSLDYQGYMEGAALTGAVVADEIAADFGLSARISSLSTTAQRVMARARLARTSRKRLATLRRLQPR